MPSKLEIGSLDGGEDGEHTGAGFVEILEVCAMQGALSIKMEPFDKVQSLPNSIVVEEIPALSHGYNKYFYKDGDIVLCIQSVIESA